MEMVPVAVEAMGHVDVPPGITSLGKDELAKILSDNGMDAASVTSIAGPEVTEIKSATGKRSVGNCYVQRLQLPCLRLLPGRDEHR